MKSQSILGRRLLTIASFAALGVLILTIPGRAFAAAEIELGKTSMADGLASAFVILRNNDQPRGYASVTIHCVFLRGGQSVGETSAQVANLKYREHLAERLSTFIKGETFDNAVCTLADAPPHP
jgi:hypothetical protein